MRKYHWRNAFTHGVGKGFKTVSNKRKDFCLHSDDVKGSTQRDPQDSVILNEVILL